ncbi:hypothetical protein BC941DRAFT_455934 [Chlamydoabsidia padenii]|nr:hypothetical protein BC941DRAFT_455934 [Chlamydoabsidia padenii]
MVDFALFVGQINHRINDYDMALRRSHDQQTGQAVIAFVNTKPDDVAQLATRYDANQIGYLRKLIELIVMADDETFSVRSLVAIQLGQRMEPVMTSKAIEEFLDQLVSDQWLVLSRGAFGLSTRTLLELAGYLKEQYAEVIKECHMCSDVVTMGERCDLQTCGVRLHHHCAEQLFVTNHQALQCPTCSTSWSRSNTFGLSL